MHSNPTAWTKDKINFLYEKPFFSLVNQAYGVHLTSFPEPEMELCTLMSIKTGTCPEDCAYCPQSGHYKTGVKKEKLLDIELIRQQAKVAKEKGAKRFCMGAAWKFPPAREFSTVLEILRSVKALGLETCMTLGSLSATQAAALKEAGLDFYNHNLDSSPEFYKTIITTRTYQERLDTLKKVADAGIGVCCGGIIGMGESREDRIGLLYELSQLDHPPDSVPINKLIPIPGTPLENVPPIDNFEFIRMIAVTRIILPKSVIRLSAGRDAMTDEMQAFCFMAGANSIFYGETLLTADNPAESRDLALLSKLNINYHLPSSALSGVSN